MYDSLATMNYSHISRNSFYLYPLIIILLLENRAIGKTYLYAYNRYIPLGDIAHCEKIEKDVTWPKQDLSYIITMKSGKIYKLAFYKNNIPTNIQYLLDSNLLGKENQ